MSNAKVAQIYVELQAQTAQFKAALGEATNATRQFSAQTRREMETAKGSIALLGEQMGVVLPRHLRTFVAGLPGVATAMSAAFNAVAVFALIDIVVKAGEKVAEFASKSQSAAQKNAEAWDKQHNSAKVAIADLDLANIRLENQLDKLEHKPENKLAESIAEVAAETAKLNENLIATIVSSEELLKTQNVSLLGSIWGDKAGTGYEQTMMQQHKLHMADAVSMQDKLNESQSFYNSLLTRQNELQAVSKGKETYQDASGATRQSTLNPATDFSAEAAAIRQMLDTSRDEQSIISGTITNTVVKGKVDAVTGANQASADRLQALEQEIEKRKALHQVSIGEEVLYWEKYAQTFAEGSKEYISALEKASQAEDALLKNFNSPGTLKTLRKQETESTDRGNVAPAGFTISPDGTLSLIVKGDEALAAANAKAAESQAKLNAEWVTASDKLNLLTGAITPHEAALNEAAAHAAEYKTEIAALTQQLSLLQVNDALASALGGDPALAAKEEQIKQQIQELEVKGNIQAMDDAQQELTTTWKGMVDSVWDELISKANDTEHELQQIATRTIDSLNSEIAKAMLGKKTDFKSVFENSAQSLAKTGLQTAEGSILKMLGLGGHKKADGYHVWVDNLSGAGNGEAIPGLSAISAIMGKNNPTVSGPAGSLLNAGGKGLLGMLNDSNFFSSLFGGKLFGSGSLFGRFATGGDVTGGLPIEVGELGAERFIPPSNGRIIPNKDLHSAPSIGYIDARGTDPALTRANFTRALQMTHAQAVSDAQRSMTERMRRRPQ